MCMMYCINVSMKLSLPNAEINEKSCSFKENGDRILGSGSFVESVKQFLRNSADKPTNKRTHG